MKKLKLSDFVNKHGLSVASVMLGMKKPSLHKALSLNRQVTVEIFKDGTCKAFEVKPFPSTKKQAA